MTILQSIIIGLVQGIAEFLPISSSGHIAILQYFFKINEGNLFYSIMLHFSTGLSVILVFRKDFLGLIKAFFSLINKLIKKKKLQLNNIYEKLLLLIIVATIPTVILGLLAKDFFEQAYTNMFYVGVSLIITGFLLFVSEKYSKSKHNLKQLPFYKAAIIGIFQGFAIMPGISRSGSTIVGALFVGLNKKDAARFSFLLSIPAIFGGLILELLDFNTTNVILNFNLIIGMIVSFIFGIIAIKVLLKIIEKGKLFYFSIYVWILGIFLLTYF